MRFIITTPYPVYPRTCGSAVRATNIANNLSRLGHKVVVLSPAKDVKNSIQNSSFTHQRYRALGSVGHFFNPFFYGKLRSEVLRGADAIVCHFPYQALMLTHLSRRWKIPLIYDAHNVEADRFASLLPGWRSLLVSLVEKRVTRASRAVFAVCESDRSRLKELYGCEPFLLPNGWQEDLIDSIKLGEGYRKGFPLRLLFVGSFDYEPNREAVEFFLGKVWQKILERYPTALFRVVGRGAPRWERRFSRVFVSRFVSSIIPFLREAHVVVVPLLNSHGTPLKLVEALAAGKWVMTTSAVSERLDEQAKKLIWSADPDSFAEALLNHLAELESSTLLNLEARRWAQEFRWDRLVRNISWDEIIKAPPHSCGMG